MDRREFLRKLAGGGVAAAAAITLRPLRPLLADDRVGSPDLAAVMGGSPQDMFDAGIAALGGIRAFIRPGQVVAIKPNISWASAPERGATTSPRLVQRICEHCLEAGARRVYVFDNTIHSWESCYRETGMEAAVKAAGGTMAPAHTTGYYQSAAVPGSRLLRNVQVHELVLEADVLINVPVLKHHGSTRMTGALKNLMGVVWDRGAYHRTGLHRCIAEFPLLRKPVLNVVDAYTVMMSGGPQGTSFRTSLELRKMQILSPDIVAVDAAASRVLGVEPGDIAHIGLAAELGLGSANLDSLGIERIRL